MSLRDSIFLGRVRYRRAHNGQPPAVIALAPGAQERLAAEVEADCEQPEDSRSTDRVWGLPVLVDPSVPEDPGFELRATPADAADDHVAAR